MSGIAHIALFPYLQPRRDSLPQPQDNASGTFSDLLDGPASSELLDDAVGGGERERADPFSALGMFGRDRANMPSEPAGDVAAAAVPSWRDVVTQKLSHHGGHPELPEAGSLPPPLAPSIQDGGSPVPEAIEPAIAQSTLGSAKLPRSGEGTRAGTSVTDDATPSQPPEPVQAEFVSQDEAGPEQAMRSSGRMAPFHQWRASNRGPFLTVTGVDRALEILAQLYGTPEAMERFRKRIEQVVAEFGMSVSELHLNGAAAESFQPRVTGDKHGNRSR